MALVSNAAITHGKTEFLLSTNLINALVLQAKDFGRGVYNWQEISAFFAAYRAMVFTFLISVISKAELLVKYAAVSSRSPRASGSLVSTSSLTTEPGL